MNEYKIRSFTNKPVILTVIADCEAHAAHIARAGGYGVLKCDCVYTDVNLPDGHEGIYSVKHA